MMFKKLHIIFFLGCFLIASVSLGQSRNALEKKHKKTQEDIKYTNSLLKKTQRDKKISMNQLMILNKKIAARQELINTITEEVKILNKKINETLESIELLEKDLKKLTTGYAKMIVFAYKTRSSYDKVVFILAANDFNMAYRRLKYLQQYADYRKKQMEKIVVTRQELSEKVEELKTKKESKELLLSEEETETKQLSSEKGEHAKMLTILKSKEEDLKKKLAEQKLSDQKLKKAINDLIAEEIRKAELARKEKLRKEKELREKNAKNNVPDDKTNVTDKTKKVTVFDLTPAEQIVSDKFEANKGKLPWPIERGIVTGTFGEHDHPVLKGIKIKNDGVYISTTQGSVARTIFDGTVSKIISIPGKNKAIIIRHGDFLSVYSNLKDVSVNVGEKVKAKQKIGTVFTDQDDDNKTILELQIWQGTIKQNPESWLSSSN